MNLKKWLAVGMLCTLALGVGACGGGGCYSRFQRR